VNAEFQRIARRDKKAFLSDQRKEIEENNRMGKTRDLFKKIRYQGLISFRMDWLDFLAVQESSPTPQFKSFRSSVLSFLYSSTHIHT